MQWDEELNEVAREAALRILRKAHKRSERQIKQDIWENEIPVTAEEADTLGHALSVLESMEEPAVQYSGREEVDLVRAGLSPDQAYHYRTSDGEEGTLQCKPERPGRDFPVSDGPNPHAVDPDGLFSARTPASVRSVGTLEKRIEKLMGRTEDLNGRIAGVERTVNEAVATSLVNLDRQLDHARQRTNGLDDRVEKLESMDTAVTKQSVKDIADLIEAVSDEIGADAVRRVENIVNRFGARLGALEAGGVEVPAGFNGIADLTLRVEHLEAHVETLVEWREEWEGPGE